MASNCRPDLKRRRSSNFTARERYCLIRIINKYRNIVENKRTDHASNAQKNSIWQMITDEFNSSGPAYIRTTISLKKWYDNQKKNRRKVGTSKVSRVKLGTAPLTSTNGIKSNTNLFNVQNPVGLLNVLPKIECDNVSEDETPLVIEGIPAGLSSDLSSKYDNLCQQSMSIQSSSTIDTSSIIEANILPPINPVPNRFDSLHFPRDETAIPPRIESINANTPSDLVLKYDNLAIKKLVIADLKEKKLRDEIAFQKIEFERKEKEAALRERALLLDIEIKEMELKRLKIIY